MFLLKTMFSIPIGNEFLVTMTDKDEKTFEETIVAGYMEEAKKTAQESNPEAKIVSANWVYK